MHLNVRDMVSLFPLLELSRSMFYRHLEQVAQTAPGLQEVEFAVLDAVRY